MRKLFALLVLLVLSVPALADRSPKRRHINLPNRPLNAPFSDGVMVGDTLYLAGRIGLDKHGKVPTSMEEEIKNLLDGFTAVLKIGGMTMDDLVTVQVFCPDLALYDGFNAQYKLRFNKDFPARAFIGSGTLLFGAHFEMQGVAVRAASVVIEANARK
jgi:2-iminobutanoate/2-iminopropanoate deaminase